MRGVVPWIWDEPGRAAGAVRATLGPVSLGVDAVTGLKAMAYRRGFLRSRVLPRPSVSVGNLAVGGTGKTPIASWMAASFAARDIVPGVLLRGYGGDEGQVHREAVPRAIVVENPDRFAGAATAVARGAEVLILDDGFQRLDIARDLDMVLVAAESLGGRLRTFPAGPWRERAGALQRASMVVVTRKSATPAQAHQAAGWVRQNVRAGCPVVVAHLEISGFRKLWSGAAVTAAGIRGRRVVATAGLAQPRSFGAQLSRMGADVKLFAWGDHHRYQARDVGQVVAASRDADVVVMTAKDAVKLRTLWPRGGQEPLVARLDVRWETGEAMIHHALETLSIRGGESR